MTKEMKMIRMNMLGGMDSYIRELGDESIWEAWIVTGVPDEATEEDFESIAEIEEDFVYMVALFNKLIQREYKKNKR